MDDFELERMRRSLVMAARGAPAGWTTDQALVVVEELVAARQQLKLLGDAAPSSSSA